MSRVWFRNELETVATFWRVLRKDGVTIGLTTHDRDLWIDGIRHSATPGMLPSAIARSAGFEPDSAEVEGALSHDSLPAADLAAGRFDGARVLIGLVDWESGENHILYRGAIGTVSEEAGKFTAQLQSRKAELRRDPVPRTSPYCRAAFCGPECRLSSVLRSHEAQLVSANAETGHVSLLLPAGVAPAALAGGELRWWDGPHAGTVMGVIASQPSGLLLDKPLAADLEAGLRCLVREGCDRTLETCATRFGNAINFQGEPFLPGNDLVARYPIAPA